MGEEAQAVPAIVGATAVENAVVGQSRYKLPSGKRLRYVRVQRRLRDGTKLSDDESATRAGDFVIGLAIQHDDVIVFETLTGGPAFQRVIQRLKQMRQLRGILLGTNVENGWFWEGYCVNAGRGDIDTILAEVITRQYPKKGKRPGKPQAAPGKDKHVHGGKPEQPPPGVVQ